ALRRLARAARRAIGVERARHAVAAAITDAAAVLVAGGALRPQRVRRRAGVADLVRALVGVVGRLVVVVDRVRGDVAVAVALIAVAVARRRVADHRARGRVVRAARPVGAGERLAGGVGAAVARLGALHAGPVAVALRAAVLV